MSTTDDSNPFTSTERYYAKYRPRYGDTAIRYLKNRFELDESSRVLDLGCGAGQIAIPLAAHVGEVIGMDPNKQMLQEARKHAEKAKRENIEWIVGSDSDLGDQGTFWLTTLGRSFHWMDEEETLKRLYSMTESGGGIAILNDTEWMTRGKKDWQEDVYTIASKYIENLPRRGAQTYEDPWDEKVEESGFNDVDVTVFEREWNIDSIVGYVFSLSYCSPEVFGNDREAFENDLRDYLSDQDTQLFVQDAEVEIISGRKQHT